MTAPQPGRDGEAIRARADEMAPRVNADGSINATHVAIEQTLRQREGLPSYIAELDGPGKFRPAAPSEPPAETCGAAIATGGICHLLATHWDTTPCERYPEPPAEAQQNDARAVGDVTPTAHELSTARSWAWTTSKPPASVQELTALIATALAHERERLAYLAARPSADTEVEETAQRVLIAHQRRDIKGCLCGTWGSDHGHLGQSHAGHLLAELRAAGLDLVAR